MTGGTSGERVRATPRRYSQDGAAPRPPDRHGSAAYDGPARLAPHRRAALHSAQLLGWQRTAGNRAVQQVVQRNGPNPAESGAAIGFGGRQPTPIQMSLFKAGDYVSAVVEGEIQYPDPNGAPDASPAVSAGEFGATLKSRTVEFSASLLKVPNPLDDTVNTWLDLGERVKVSSSLALFKLAADEAYKDMDIEAGFNFGEIELALSGTFDHTTMATTWGRKYFGGTALGDALAQKKAVFVGKIKLGLALPAEDAARLAQAAALHRRLKAMAYQNKVWMQEIAARRSAIKSLTASYSLAPPLERINIAKQLGEHRAALKQLGKGVAQNKRLGRELLGQAARLTKALSAAFKATIGRFIPIANAYLLVTDAIRAIEVIYGLVTGKGYSFSLSGDDGGSGAGEEPGGGGAEEGGGAAAAGTPATGEEAFAGLEHQAAGGGTEYAKPVDLNPNALQVYTVLVTRTAGRLTHATLTVLNGLITADLGAEEMKRLLGALRTAKLSRDPAQALSQVAALVKKVGEAVGVEGTGPAGTAGTGKEGTGAGGAGQTGGTQDEDEILLEDPPTYDTTPAVSQTSEALEPHAGAQQPAATPAGKEGAAEPDVVDPEIKAFMARALAAIAAGEEKGYAEFDQSISYNDLSVGTVFSGKVAVFVANDVTNEHGEVVSTETAWYGGEAQFKVVKKLPDGQLEVIRSVMPAYNRYGRHIGKRLAAARMTVGYRRELALTP